MEAGNQRLGRTARLAVKVIFTLCLMGTLVFIFYNSSKIGAISGGKSQAVMDFVNGILAKLGIGYRFSHYAIRKLAHFTEYAMLGFWLMLTLRIYTRRILSFIAWPLFLGLLTAVMDEFYQLFIPDRSGQVKDIVIDFAGVTAGLLAGLFALLLFSAIWEALHGKR